MRLCIFRCAGLILVCVCVRARTHVRACRQACLLSWLGRSGGNHCGHIRPWRSWQGEGGTVGGLRRLLGIIGQKFGVREGQNQPQRGFSLSLGPSSEEGLDNDTGPLVSGLPLVSVWYSPMGTHFLQELELTWSSGMTLGGLLWSSPCRPLWFWPHVPQSS